MPVSVDSGGQNLIEVIPRFDLSPKRKWTLSQKIGVTIMCVIFALPMLALSALFIWFLTWFIP